jgi:hypothetical protein
MVVVLTVGCGSARACPAGQLRKRRAGPPGPVRRRTAAGTRAAVVEAEGQPSGLGWLPDGSLVVVSMKDHRVLQYADGTLSTHADLTEHCGGHLDDLVVTDAGQVFVGDFDFDLMGAGTRGPRH